MIWQSSFVWKEILVLIQLSAPDNATRTPICERIKGGTQGTFYTNGVVKVEGVQLLPLSATQCSLLDEGLVRAVVSFDQVSGLTLSSVFAISNGTNFVLDR